MALRQAMALHNSSGIFRFFYFLIFFQTLERAMGPSLLLVCFSASSNGTDPPVPRHVKRGVIYRNYPKGGSPQGELTALFRTAEVLSYFQVVLKIIQQFLYIFYRLCSRFFLLQLSKSRAEITPCFLSQARARRLHFDIQWPHMNLEHQTLDVELLWKDIWPFSE